MLIKSALRSLIESPNLDFGFAYATVPCKWVQEPNLHWLQVEETCPRRFQMNVVNAILFLTLLFYNRTQNISYVTFYMLIDKDETTTATACSKTPLKSCHGPKIFSVAFSRETWRQKY